MSITTIRTAQILRPGLFLIAVSLLAGPVAADTCDSEWFCVNDLKIDGNVELHVENLSQVPLTFTLRVKTRYFDADGPKRITQTIAPNSSQKVIVLSKDGGSRSPEYRYTYDWTIGDKDANHDDDHIYHFPYGTGTSYRVLQGYGSRFSHTGLEQFAIDFKMDEGTPVHAARGGIVARKEESHSKGCWEDGCGKYANYLVILHDDDTTGEYYHLQKNGVLVEIGDRVSTGQLVALSGNTGHTTMPHLHFGVYRAVSRGREQSIPVRFVSADGVVDKPRRGGRYLAVLPQNDEKVD
jgi:murein DD-endopeptidase MepM/ murein hydrolase activator NlpD